MIKTTRQVRAAFSLLNPAEIRRRSTQRVVIGLVAEHEGAYQELEQFLVLETSPSAARSLESVYRAGAGGDPQVDLVLYSQGLPCPRGAFQHRRDDPDWTMAQILREHDSEPGQL